MAYSLPELLACGLALALLWTSAAAGQPRRLGLVGVGAMLACALLQLGLGLYQQWLLHAAQGDGFATLGTVMSSISALRMLINCVSMAALVLVAWALCRATRAPQTAARPTAIPGA